jgi:hypothetical protein
MGVHVSEVHTDIVSAGAPRGGPGEKTAKPSTDAQWVENRWLIERCSARVRAECFSD